MNHNRIFSISSEEDFRVVALEVFNFQFKNNPVYRKFCQLLKVFPEDVSSLNQIPFLPIEFFKSKKVLSGNAEETIFTSSGTTGTIPSKHYVSDISLYEESFLKCFERFYGNPKDYAILALLPSYLERQGSSLIYMANHFIENNPYPESGFYLNNVEELKTAIESLERRNQKTLLLGVSFGLLDLVEKYRFQLKNTIVMETGGMKGRRKEMIREELHQILKTGFGVKNIHSEYGMTELLSQAYSAGNGTFSCPPWMKMLIRDPEDAMTYLSPGKTGGINVIDLANLYSCSFIATQDLGKINEEDQVQILGRFDNSDIRGCNLMAL